MTHIDVCRFFGMYSIKMYGHTEYFVVMNNVLRVPGGMYKVDEGIYLLPICPSLSSPHLTIIVCILQQCMTLKVVRLIDMLKQRRKEKK
jgi:hypothetical protein